MLKRLVAVTATLACLSLLASCGNEGEGKASDPATSSSSSSSEPGAGGSKCEYPADGTEPAKAATPPPAETTQTGEVPVTIATSVGDIKATLDADRAPCAVNSFVSLAEQSYFNDTDCHRLTTQGIFVLQCGDPTASGMGGPGYTIADEADGSETYGPGALAMAKTQSPDSGGSQFFLVYDDSSSLPPEYTVFGQVDEAGIKILQQVAEEGTADGGPDGSPKTPVNISSVTIG